MVDSSEFAFEPPSDEEIDYEDINSGGEEAEEEDKSDIEEKGKSEKKESISMGFFFLH